MADEKRKTDWDRTSTLLACYLNAHVSKKTYTPSELNPFRNSPKMKEIPTATKEQAKQAIKAFASIYTRNHKQ